MIESGRGGPSRVYRAGWTWNPHTVSHISAKVRAVVRLMEHRVAETIATGDFYVGLGDRFDDDRRRVHQTPGQPATASRR